MLIPTLDHITLRTSELNCRARQASEPSNTNSQRTLNPRYTAHVHAYLTNPFNHCSIFPKILVRWEWKLNRWYTAHCTHTIIFHHPVSLSSLTVFHFPEDRLDMKIAHSSSLAFLVRSAQSLISFRLQMQMPPWAITVAPQLGHKWVLTSWVQS